MGYGDWIDEPDIVEFEYRGIKCLVYRTLKREHYTKEEAYFGGHLCGYIFLPVEHPLYKKKLSEIDLDCLYGLTFTELTNEGRKIGFACAHLGDLIPTFEHLKNNAPDLKDLRKRFPPPNGYEKFSFFNPTYKNIDFCIKQCKSLAKQAATMQSKVEL